MTGTLLCNERYEVLERIGDGGAAVVYRARDHSLNRDVAVKVLRDELAQDHEFVERFQREAHAAAGLSHPNIASVFDIGFEGGRHYFVMELLTGGTLRERLARERKLSPEEALRIASQVAAALRHAHDSGIIHRDIKPQNILFTREGDVKVGDFGIARAMAASSVSQTGTIIGSVRYLAPEQAGGDGAVPQSDLYSLGIVLFEMLTGQVPFDAETPVAIALKHVQDPVPSVRAIDPTIPLAVEELLQRLLAKRVSERCPSAHQLITELYTVQQAVAVQFGRAAAPAAASDDTTRVIRRPQPVRQAYQDEVVRRSIPPNPAAHSDQMSPVTWVLVFLTAVVGIGAIVFLWLTRPPADHGGEKAPAMTTVPQVVFQPLRKAREVAAAYNLILDVEYQPTDEYEPDTVISQSPNAGIDVPVNSQLQVVVARSKEPETSLVTVPNVVGLDSADALDRLRKLGLDPHPLPKASEEVEKGLVMRQDVPPETQVAKGSPIRLDVSDGPPAPIDIPPDDGLDRPTPPSAPNGGGEPVAPPKVEPTPPSVEPGTGASGTTGKTHGGTRPIQPLEGEESPEADRPPPPR
ncbi:MAG TPA: Stk1 family PASTA domain-containing Ser/Thr kinase [Armatimonadota bacterium]|nr:Stk1 family PASTA domain-containing Ser/Thr kinase [Armatimonadota bacterium]